MNRFAPLMLALLAWQAPAQDGPDRDTTQPARFSAARPGEPLPGGWTVKHLPKVERATAYALVDDAGVTVLRATSDAAAASVATMLDPASPQRRVLAWRWKVSRVIQGADLATKAGDDFAARVYVLFGDEALTGFERLQLGIARMIYGRELPAFALCYVWDNSHPVGTSVWNAYTDRVRMIVMESGAEHAGEWVRESRDVVDDFQAAFGRAAPPVAGVALAADTDNTGEAVVTHFGDVAFRTATGGVSPRP